MSNPIVRASTALLASLAGTLVAAQPDSAAPVSRGVVAGFSDWVTAVAFSPDGSMLAAGTYDELRLVDPATQKVIETIKTANGYVRGLAFSADGSQIVVGDYQSLSLWDVKTGRRLKAFAGHTGYVTAVAFARDRIVSASEDGTVRVWNAETGEVLQAIDVSVPVNDVAVSPDLSQLAVAAGDTTRPNRPGLVTLWDPTTGQQIGEFVGHERAALAVVFSPDGARLASAGEDEKVNLHDVAAQKAIGYYAGHSRSVNDVAFLADGAVLASVSGGNAGALCELRLWKPDGTELAAAEPHEQRITALAVSPDGHTLALASHDKTVSLWDVGPVLDANGSRPPVVAPKPTRRS